MAHEFLFISVRKGKSDAWGMTLLGTGPCIVSDVTSDGPACRANVKPGFVVLEINGRNVVQNNHKEVREIIRSADTQDSITFKFATLDKASQYFGPDLRIMYESCSKKRRSSGSVKSSPRKSDQKISVTDGGKGKRGGSGEETKENAGNPFERQPPPRLTADGGVDPADSISSNQLSDDPKRPATPPRIAKPVPLPRFGPEVTRRSHVQQNRDLSRWMRSNAEQQALNSPIRTATAAPRSASPQTSPTTPSVEFVCLYYSNLVDLLGCPEESVFRKNVQYLRNYQVPSQFWARLVFTEKRLTVYRPEGKYATYTTKHMRDVFIHEDRQFFGFSTIRVSKVQGTSPTNTRMESEQTMDVYHCHILCVDPTIKSDKAKQRSVLASLFGKDFVGMKSSAFTSACFPDDAYKIVELLESLNDNSESAREVNDVANLLSSNIIPPPQTKTVEEECSETDDATDHFNSASVLRHSMRKYGPYGNLQNRHSISIDSLHTAPRRPAVQLASNRYSCIIGNTVPPSERSQAKNLPATIAEHQVLKLTSQGSTDTYDSLSSYDHDSAWTRDVASSLDLTAHTSTSVSYGDEGCFQDPIYRAEKPEPLKIELFHVLNTAKGLDLFQAFLKQEHSQENINFWLACQEYRMLKKSKEMRHMAKKMFERFLSPHAPESINVDGEVRKAIQCDLPIATTSTFDIAAKQIFDLMNSDSFPRFLRSPNNLQLRQLLDPNPYHISQSMACLTEPDQGPVSAGGRRESGLFSWLSNKKKPEYSLETSHVSRQSLPASHYGSPNVSFQSVQPASPKNAIKKLINKGRKSFSARVKPTKRESLLNFVSDSELRGDNPESRVVQPLAFEFRKPMTPPPKSEVILRKNLPKGPNSAGKEQKRLSLQGLQRSRTKGVTEPTEWTFSRNSLDDCLAERPMVPPKPHELVNIQRSLKPIRGGRPSTQLLQMADF
ncbi:putative Regulator of G-protein signaling 16 [Hypsibius exemplaris]|uniref:Regulator of G-protein signaling 16 n=1 Tax=Hypsibius exemplaris TaxID=2072580 RepID=A0A1W0WT28_HYPEX|nr:putative Regulator of G-protein signaling 16 [Hypsibius exemplaris]